MTDISRRSFIGLLSAVPLVAASTVAAPQGAFAATSTLYSDTYGPDGSHWPSRTPRPTDTFVKTIECDCNWTAIGNAITSLKDVSKNDNVRILVRPGRLAGNGAGSSSRPVLERIGQTGRGRRILIMPRDGSQSITFDASIRMDRVSGVSFVGFWTFPSSLVLTGVSDFAWAWSKGRAFNVSTNSTAAVSDVEFVECVTPESQLTESDAWAFRTAGSTVTNLSVVGCYIASMYKPEGSTAHLDTLQLSGSHSLKNVVMEDTVIFASTNAAFIPTELATGVRFDHSLLVAGASMLKRYPLPAGSKLSSVYPQAANGSGTNGVLSARDSIMIGSVPGVWAAVENAHTSAAKTYANSGGWTYDPTLSDVSSAWLDSRTPMPTDEYLRSVWKI
ncbi:MULTISPECIES: hypothetical protein [Microbacterium]|uniref:hypothetical protein n=1 Tax=Microbacterium TaxID=33882 RepID=UPI002782C5A7|nr:MULTISPECIES: hypothetical protein [Microbacterium]MDQ1084634.1 hypothetical protein [Microbacterium sp. SORGH_AS_0344]MDQ1170089.1 hypothetical protein [Microbacterium proteolyticum]